MHASVAHLFFLLALVFTCALGAAVPREELVELDKRLSTKGTKTGQGTFYETGLGACGKTNHDSDLIAAVSHTLFDEYPGYNGANPNHNPICGKKIKATYKGKSVTVKVVDRCVGCATWDLDFSPSAFTKLASKSVGRLSGVKWEFD